GLPLAAHGVHPPLHGCPWAQIPVLFETLSHSALVRAGMHCSTPFTVNVQDPVSEPTDGVLPATTSSSPWITWSLLTSFIAIGGTSWAKFVNGERNRTPRGPITVRPLERANTN